MPIKPTIFAIDFGTSNSLLAAASPGNVFAPAPLDVEAEDPTVLRSALYFQSLSIARFGSGARKAFVENGFRGRLVRSIKRHLPSRSFTHTRIGDKLVEIETLIGAFLRFMREEAGRYFQVDVRRALLGRPARFSNDPELDQLAEERLGRAAKIAGFEEVTFCPEPVAAAYDFAADLEEPRLVLVADLGGGTSDFTLVRMQKSGFRPSDVLAVGGVAVAGDAIDGALVGKWVAPEYGSRTRYRVPFGANVLDMPSELVELLSSPADLTLVDRARILRSLSDIQAGAIDVRDREKLEKYRVVVEDGVGFELYEGVERTKRRLSEVDTTELVLDYPGAELDLAVTRSELEGAATRPVERLLQALDDTLATARVTPEAVEIVCLTGGTSRVPFVEQSLRARLPNARVRQLSSFHSVVQGLARKAAEIA